MSAYWEVLGIAPTGDVLAIKKAYAGLLKKNRPDEAPEAYQMLREAYEWAMSEAEWLRRSAGQSEGQGENDSATWTAGGHASGEPASAGDLVFPPVSAPSGFAVTEHEDAIAFDHDSAHALHRRWAERLAHCEAEEADACWQSLQRELDALPLDALGDASLLFADFVLEHELLPSALLTGLARHFRWGQDYRDAERLGAFRVTQLRERLAQDAPTLFRDARQVERATELLRLDWVLQRQGALWGWLYAALAGPHLRRLQRDTDDRQRRALEISYLRWEALETAMQRAGVLRLIFVLACVMPLVYALAPAEEAFLDWVSMAALFAAAYWFAAWGFGRSLPGVGAEISRGLAMMDVFDTWQSRVAAAVAVPLIIALLAHDEGIMRALFSVLPEGALGFAAVLLCAVALLIPPENDEERQVMLPMLGALTLALTALVPEGDAAWVVAMGVAGAWIALGGWVYHSYHDQVMAYYRAPWTVLRPRAWWAWVLVVVAFKLVVSVLVFVLTLALPVTLRVLARYLSVQTAWLAIGLGAGIAMVVSGGNGGEAFALPALVVAAAALMGLQALAEWASRKLFHRVPDTFFGNDE